ncbi:hypothetical protein RUND412_004010 [Rhizina undulata]
MYHMQNPKTSIAIMTPPQSWASRKEYFSAPNTVTRVGDVELLEDSLVVVEERVMVLREVNVDVDEEVVLGEELVEVVLGEFVEAELREFVEVVLREFVETVLGELVKVVLGEFVEAVLGECVEAVKEEYVESVLGGFVEAVFGEFAEVVLGEFIDAPEVETTLPKLPVSPAWLSVGLGTLPKTEVGVVFALLGLFSVEAIEGFSFVSVPVVS